MKEDEVKDAESGVQMDDSTEPVNSVELGTRAKEFDNMSIMVRIQKQNQSKLLNINDQIAELKTKQRTIEEA